MADPGFLSGCIGVAIDIAIGQILNHVVIAVSWKRVLESLRDLVTSIKRTVTQIHQCRDINASEINTWIIKLDALLQGALTVVQKCSIPRFALVSRHKTRNYSRRITALISEIEKHLKWVSLVQLQQQMQMQMEMRRESAQPSSSTSATTSEGLSPSTGGFSIQEADIEGADIEMGLNQQPEGNNNTQQESGIVATPHYVYPMGASASNTASTSTPSGISNDDSQFHVYNNHRGPRPSFLDRSLIYRRLHPLFLDTEEGADIEMGLNQQPEGNNNTDIEMGLNQQPEGNNNTDIEMGLNQQPEGNNNTQQESGIVATPPYVRNISTSFATCHGVILAVVMMSAPASSEVRIFILFVSALVSVAIIRDLGVNSYKEFSAKRRGQSLRNSLLANQRWVTERIALFLIFIMFSLGLLLVSNRELKHH